MVCSRAVVLVVQKYGVWHEFCRVVNYVAAKALAPLRSRRLGGFCRPIRHVVQEKLLLIVECLVELLLDFIAHACIVRIELFDCRCTCVLRGFESGEFVGGDVRSVLLLLLLTDQA